ncbi:MAG: tRNA lysidine(34) synthetase TilS [Pseudomonadota bacterium]|nr:tRNA lysidine(34) synthetase TilS [Pseudomonadota bacterium]
MNSLAAHLLDQLTQMPAASRYRVAYSGGCDSHVLLQALAGLREQLAAPLEAIHINHRLSDQADDWAEHCRRICAALELPLAEVTVHAHPRLGESPEAAAREARYNAWRELLQAGEGLLLAQHQDDQAETLLLQLLRGSGPKGLAAMPPVIDFAAGWLGRPLLGQSRAALRRYAREQGLEWIEDPSNFDTDLDRNYLRHELLPVLQARWPSASLTLSRAARHQAEAGQLLEELAAQDYILCQSEHAECLRLAPLQALSPARQRNLLRYWLASVRQLPLPDSTHLNRILDEVLYAAPDAQPQVAWTGAQVRRYASELYALSTRPAPDCGDAGWHDWDPLRQPRLTLAGRVLEAEPAVGQGLSRQQVEAHGLQVGFRQGGEWCRPAGRGHRHELKKLLQEWRVPPWQRAEIPLIRIDEEIAQVVDYCLCEPYIAAEDEPGLLITLRDTAGI